VDDQQLILGETVYQRTLKKKLQHLISDILEGSTIIFMCIDKWTGHWLIQVIYGHGLREGTALKEIDMRKLLKLNLRLHSNN
jgi:hypothetical protein